MNSQDEYEELEKEVLSLRHALSVAQEKKYVTQSSRIAANERFRVAFEKSWEDLAHCGPEAAERVLALWAVLKEDPQQPE